MYLVVVQLADILPWHELIDGVAIGALAVAYGMGEVGERPFAEAGRFVRRDILRHRDAPRRARNRTARQMIAMAAGAAGGFREGLAVGCRNSRNDIRATRAMMVFAVIDSE